MSLDLKKLDKVAYFYYDLDDLFIALDRYSRFYSDRQVNYDYELIIGKSKLTLIFRFK